jgi:two-component system response regulator NreC
MPLSRREREVLTLLAEGHANRMVAERLFLSVKTVETYRTRIADKLGLRTRADLVRYALESGLLGPNPPAPGGDGA